MGKNHKRKWPTFPNPGFSPLSAALVLDYKQNPFGRNWDYEPMRLVVNGGSNLLNAKQEKNGATMRGRTFRKAAATTILLLTCLRWHQQAARAVSCPNGVCPCP